MSVENFLDTNIFVYLFDETDDDKRERAERLVQQALENETGRLTSSPENSMQRLRKLDKYWTAS